MTGKLAVRLVTSNGEPLRIPGVLLDIRFYVDGQFRYSFSLGPTDDGGVCSTSMQQIEQELEVHRRFFLMDYNTPLADCDTTIGIVAPTADELAQREAARAKWWPERPSLYGGVANERVRCPEQKFRLQPGSGNAFPLACEATP